MRRNLDATSLFKIIGLAASLSLALACGDGSVTIGVIVPETGDYDSYGTAIRKGIEIATAEIQADPNAPFELETMFYDSSSDPEMAASLLEQAYKDGANVVIGGATSGEALQMSGVVDRFDRILVSPSASSPDLTGISSNFYRIFPSDLLEANKLASFAADEFEDDMRIMMLWQPDSYGEGIRSVFQQEFEKLGGMIEDAFQLAPGDPSGIVDAVVAANPPGLLIAGYDSNVADALVALRKGGYRGMILTTSAFGTPAGLERAGDAADGVIMTQVVFEVDSDHAHIKKFVDAYEARFNERPDIYAAHGYDALRVAVHAMSGRPQLHGELLKGFRAVKEFPGVTGAIQFDERGDVKKFPRVYQIDDGTLVDYEERKRQRREELERKKRELQERLKRLSQGGG